MYVGFAVAQTIMRRVFIDQALDIQFNRIKDFIVSDSAGDDIVIAANFGPLTTIDDKIQPFVGIKCEIQYRPPSVIISTISRTMYSFPWVCKTP